MPANGALLHPVALLEFFATQFAVAGPMLFRSPPDGQRAARIRRTPRSFCSSRCRSSRWSAFRRCLSRAYGNWAFAAYLPGTLAAVAWHDQPGPAAGSGLSLAINARAVAGGPGADHLRHRPHHRRPPDPCRATWAGKTFAARSLILADETRPAAIVTTDRDVLADLFLTGQRSRSRSAPCRRRGRAMNYYEQTYPLEPSKPRAGSCSSPTASACFAEPRRCARSRPSDTEGGAYDRQGPARLSACCPIAMRRCAKAT